MIFPRMIALSEVLWSPKEKRNWNDFEKRLPSIFERLEREKTNYSKAYYDLQGTVLPTKDFNGVIWQLESKCATCKILLKEEKHEIDSFSIIMANIPIHYSTPIKFESFSFDKMTAFLVKGKIDTLSQSPIKLHFNEATGKKITIATEPSVNYPGDGAFTLVNGVQNEKGLAKGNEFLGFLGKDLDAIIDLGAVMDIKKVTLHTLEQNGSWIYLPSKVEVMYMYSIDTGKNALLGPPDKMLSVDVQQGKNISKIEIPGQQRCRYIRVVAKNYGIIPSGNPGAGNAAWLFADEIEVE